MPGKILITGVSGFLGRALANELAGRGYRVIGLSRTPDRSIGHLENRVEIVRWLGDSSWRWNELAENAVAIVNLAGENVAAGRWTARKKRAVLQSRLLAIEAIAAVTEKLQNRPPAIIQASAIGYYGNRPDEILDETADTGDGFLAEVCRQQEQTAKKLYKGSRLVIARFGAVLGQDGGLIAEVAPKFRRFGGLCPGSGSQWISWIHIEDAVRAICFLIEKNDSQGIFNLVSSNPAIAEDFYRGIAETIGCPMLGHMPPILIRAAMGKMANEMILASQRVLPKGLQKAGYTFMYPELAEALKQIFANRQIEG